jgi:hypothetical protein
MLPDNHPFTQYVVKQGWFKKKENPGKVICKSYGSYDPKLEDFYLTFADTDNY